MQLKTFPTSSWTTGCAVVVVLAGCTGEAGRIKPPSLGIVQGRVTLDDDPLPNALVEFVPAHARPSTGMTNDDGVYQLEFDTTKKGAAVGDHVVRIVTKIAAGPDKEAVPEKYNLKSELKVTVEEGDNTFDWDLKSK